jgi:hypothetical protein
MTATLTTKPLEEVKLTEEQLKVVNSVTDSSSVIHILDSFAGSGKTTTWLNLVKKAKKANPDAVIQIMMYSKTLKDESEEKLEQAGFTSKQGVHCNTIHSLAYNNLNKIRRANGLSKLIILNSATEFYNIVSEIKNKNEHYKYVSNISIKKLYDLYSSTTLFTSIDDFCNHVVNSDILLATCRIITSKNNNVEDTVDFFKMLYEYMMSKGLYTFEMLIKEYSLMCNDIIYVDYLVIDEAQDLDIFMLNILKRIVYSKMYLIGDPAQQINQFRGVVDVMDIYDKVGEHYALTISHRLNDMSCSLCNALLSLTRKFRERGYSIKPGHNISEPPTNNPTITQIQRTRRGIIFELTEYLKENPDGYINVLSGGSKVSFNSLIGNKLEFMYFLLKNSTYSYAAGKLLNAFPDYISNKKLTAFQKESLEKVRNNKQNIISYYEEIGDDKERKACSLIRSFINKNVLDEHKMVSDLLNIEKAFSRKIPKGVKNSDIFTIATVHSSKGLEYDKIVIGDDYWCLDTYEGLYIAYVAVSRGRFAVNAKPILYALEPYLKLIDNYDWEVTKYGSRGFYYRVEQLFKYYFQRLPNKEECSTLAKYAYSKLHNLVEDRKKATLKVYVHPTSNERKTIASTYIDNCMMYLSNKYTGKQLKSSFVEDIQEFISMAEKEQLEENEILSEQVPHKEETYECLDDGDMC